MTRKNPTDPEGVKILAHWAKRTPGAVRGGKVRGGVSITVEYHPLYDWLQRWPGHRRDMNECRSVTFKYVMNELDDIETESGEDYPWLHALSDDAWAWYIEVGMLEAMPYEKAVKERAKRAKTRGNPAEEWRMTREEYALLHSLETRARKEGMHLFIESDFNRQYLTMTDTKSRKEIESVPLKGSYSDVLYSTQLDLAKLAMLQRHYETGKHGRLLYDRRGNLMDDD